LARETVTQKEVEAGEGGILGRLHILAQRNHAGNRHRPGRRMNFARVILDDRDAVEEYRLDRGLPRPQAQTVIAQRRIVRVEHKCGTVIGVAGEIGMDHRFKALPPFLRAMARHCRCQVTLSLHHAYDSDGKGASVATYGSYYLW